MKKTVSIQLVLITAALAACNKPLYQQDPIYYSGDLPDSTNSCPMVDDYPLSYSYPPNYYIWLNGFRYYPYYSHPAGHPHVVRSGFGHWTKTGGS